MSTASDVIKMAESQIGVAENPPHSNNVLYNTWYHKREVQGKEYPWCMAFCQWVYDQCGVKLPIRTASCSAMANAARQANMFRQYDPHPGDLILLKFSAYGPTTHCGIVKGIKGEKIFTIEGNTSLSNDTNGGSVMERTRKPFNVFGMVRPNFEKGVEDMTVNEFINSLTDEQAYKLLEKAKNHANSLSTPTWLKGDDKKHWDNAERKGLIKGKPEGLVKRDELAIILGRAGCL